MPTKTKTSPSGLTPKEQQELERRGFFIKSVNFHIVSILDGVIRNIFLLTLITSVLIIDISLPLKVLWGINILTSSLFLFFSFLVIISFIPISESFLKHNSAFYGEKGVLYQGSLGQKIVRLNLSQKIKNAYGFDGVNEYVCFIFLFFAGIVSFVTMFSAGFGNLFLLEILQALIMLIKFLLIPLGFSMTLLVIRLVYQSFHPLYAFGNLGSKIQSLTPRITEESEKIEKEFSTDMNFRTLSDSFDTLSKDFSQISSYVIKLEQIEQKANKGNLFDSQKYIGSLREDIVKPLTALRSFLEKKKTELEKSKEEIRNLGALDAEINSAGQKVRVRVGGSGNGEIENLELQSKRSEPLRAELTENIAKLDMMIEKFAKI